jgi:copper chaperone
VTETSLSVPEIHCDHCKMSIEGAVGALEGVTSATVDVEARTVTIGYDAPATVQDIIAAIEGQGYEVPEQQ